MSKTVLLVEDDLNNLKLLHIALTKEGYVMAVAGNGFEALAILEKNAPDLIITDIMMPELDGLALLRAIQFRPETKGIPVIILSAKDKVDDMLRGFAEGARFYLTKPFKINELVAQVKFILNDYASPG